MEFWKQFFENKRFLYLYVPVVNAQFFQYEYLF